MLNLNRKLRILAIGAHPDDIEIGCGGTLAKYAHLGHDVYLFISTDGAAGGDSKIRRQEQEASKSILKAKEIVWGNFPDTQISICQTTINLVESVIRKINPDLIFINYNDDTHQDHRHIAAITISATRYIPNVLFYETPTTQNFQPHIFVDLEQRFFDLKIELLNAHASQINRTNILNMSILDVARSAAHFRGVQARVQYAEAFQSVRLIVNIPDLHDSAL